MRTHLIIYVPCRGINWTQQIHCFHTKRDKADHCHVTLCKYGSIQPAYLEEVSLPKIHFKYALTQLFQSKATSIKKKKGGGGIGKKKKIEKKRQKMGEKKQEEEK